MFITLDYLEKIQACGLAREWFVMAYPDGVEMTRESLDSCPDPTWVWWLGCRLDRTHTLVWVAPNIAFREAAKVCPELREWVGKVGSNNWRAADASARAADASRAADAAYAAYASRAAYAAYAARAYRAADAADAAHAASCAAYAAHAAAHAASCAAYAAYAAYAADAAARAAWKELREAATLFLLSL